MRRLAVAARNGERQSLGWRALTSSVLLVALGCGADAGGVSQRSRALEAEPDTALAASNDDEASTDQAPADDAETPDEPAAPAAIDTQPAPVVLPSSRPITEPPDPQPFPTPELETTRPVNSTEPLDIIVPPGECRFEYLGKGVRCENAGGPHIVSTDAPDLLSCMRTCLERDDCTAVTDYLWLGQPDQACQLYLSTCDDPTFAEWAEEDGGHEFRRVCD